ncbi:glycerophosphodiester phosphodiesterase [Arthrobacter zhaoxinii]|uniref:glycerophosphodiester phosphodiesterase n=1 Tax=Arthrobacter zhaoxinii TaxID=2964616 RepID=UPI002103F889|nr:glycerophosphodiester phosphodiesterase [Arthrobacter zhaoxinii]MCQ2001757.1 glycerophosphodiester phosphodiesterase [Arthrobacter zhaoxinii]
MPTIPAGAHAVHPLLSRRQLFAASAGALVLAGCVRQQPAATVLPRYNIDDLFSSSPFYIAHRGSGDNWTEHTAEAYANAIDAGVKAIEVSTVPTKDGVFVCHHDRDTARLTGVPGEIEQMTYDQVAELRTDARAWLGPSTPLLPIPKLTDILDAHVASHVLFIEDKTGKNTALLLDVLSAYPNARQHVIIKMPGESAKAARECRERGYQVWGYFAEIDEETFTKSVPLLDYLGIYHRAPDDVISRVVAAGKPVICWEVHQRWMRDRLTGLGVQGMMCSNILYVAFPDAPAATDKFTSGSRTPGDLPYPLVWTAQPQILPARASLRFEQGHKVVYQMGSMAELPSEELSISFQMRWPGKPQDEDCAGLAFAQGSDRPVADGAPSDGYAVLVYPVGRIVLLKLGPDGSSVPLDEAPATRSYRGRWMKVSARMAAGVVTVTVIGHDGGESSVSAQDTQYRGGHFSLWKAYKAAEPLEFRSVQRS